MSKVQARPQRPNRTVGLDRVVMFSDGVYAIVITLLLLEISTGHGNALVDLRHAVPEIGLFAWSFFLTARFWQLHLRLFSVLKGKVSERLVELNNQLLFF